MPTPLFVCGAECGIAVLGTASAGLEHWSALSGTPTVVTSGPSPMRSTRCFRFNTAAATARFTHTFASVVASPATLVARFYIYFATLPDVDCTIWEASSSGYGVFFESSDSTLRAGFALADMASGGKVVTTGVWYRVDVRTVRSTGATVELSVDGVAQTTRGPSIATAGTEAGFRLGHGGATTADYYIDDIDVSGTSGDFPIGAGTVVGLYPSGDGSHQSTWTSGQFTKGASGGTAAARTDSDIWSSLDNPLTGTAGGNWVGAISPADNTQYVEFVFDNPPGDVDTVNGAMVVMTTHSASATTSNFTYRLSNDGGSVTDLISADLSESTITIPVVIRNTDAAGNAWTSARLGEIRGRFASSDVNPDVYLDGVCIEVDYVQAAPEQLLRRPTFPQLLAH